MLHLCEEFGIYPEIKEYKDFPGGPVARLCDPNAGVRAPLLVKELDPTWCSQEFTCRDRRILHASSKPWHSQINYLIKKKKLKSINKWPQLNFSADINLFGAFFFSQICSNCNLSHGFPSVCLE